LISNFFSEFAPLKLIDIFHQGVILDTSPISPYFIGGPWPVVNKNSKAKKAG
jgi:hypothetical protein